jgi:hypothetical protein
LYAVDAMSERLEQNAEDGPAEGSDEHQSVTDERRLAGRGRRAAEDDEADPGDRERYANPRARRDALRASEPTEQCHEGGAGRDHERRVAGTCARDAFDEQHLI